MSVLSFADPQPLPLVLIVEDHEDTRQMYAEFFSDQYTVLEAGDGSQALALMTERRPDIVITDLSLPGLDGFELVARIRGNPDLAAIPIICLSGYGGHAHETRAREVGCNRVLQKPCMPDELAQTAADLLRGPERRIVSQPSVFVVEDDSDTREMLCRFLELEGYHVESAPNGKLALERLNAGAPACVILLDLMMPVMDGWQFRREQINMQTLAHIPVIVVSAAGRDRIGQIDANAVLSKPVDLDELLARVTEYCRTCR